MEPRLRFFTKNNELFVKVNSIEVSLKKICKTYGTPLDVEFLFLIEKRIEYLFNVFTKLKRKLNVNSTLIYFYPIKVNPRREIISTILDSGFNIGIEVGNEFELSIIKKWFKHKKFPIVCHGIKSNKYLNLISGIGERAITVIEDLNEFQKANKKRLKNIGIRLNTSSIDRFGFDNFSIKKFLKMLNGYNKNIALIHFHMGSQIKNLLPKLKRNTLASLKLIEKLIESGHIGKSLVVNLGGGIDVGDTTNCTIRDYFKTMLLSIKNFLKRYKDLEIRVGIESGQWLVAPSQITLFRVESVRILNEKIKYIIDGSFIADLPDTWGLGKKWEILPVNLLDRKKDRVYLEGKTCDNDDFYYRYLRLPLINNNDDFYICVKNTGAYQETLGNNHCMLLDANKLVIYKNGKMKLVRKRSLEEIERRFGYL